MKKIIICIVFTLVIGIGVIHAQKAGKGDYQPLVLKIDGKTDDQQKFVPDEDYIRIEEIKWFVNSQGNILKKRMVTGTVKIQLGAESYESVLPLYRLSGGNKTAPLSNRTILYNRVYPGGVFSINVYIGGVKENTAFGNLVDSLASIAIDVGIGKVGTISAIGTHPALATASQNLSGGVKNMLINGEKKYGIFDDSGFIFSFFSPQDPGKLNLTGSENFLLAYKGNTLTDVKVVEIEGTTFDVHAGSSPLRQGAWVLFRITRQPNFGSARPWTNKRREVMAAVEKIMVDWRVGAIDKTGLNEELTATTTSESVADKLLAIAHEIRSDIVLTVSERQKWSGELVSLLLLAQDAAREENASNGWNKYNQEKNKLLEHMRNGTIPSDPKVTNAFVDEYKLAGKANETALVQKILYYKENIPEQTAESSRISSLKGLFEIKALSKTTDKAKLPPDLQQLITEFARLQDSPLPNQSQMWERIGKITTASENQGKSIENPK